MKALHVLALDKLVKEQKASIQMRRPKMKDLSDELASELKFPVPRGSLRDILLANGIEIRKRDKKTVQIEVLAEEKTMLLALIEELRPYIKPQGLRARVDRVLGMKVSDVG